ncbi:DNA-3-methyladenine glycosylase [Euzebya tangerina]|uniref:DNA-3-methyladenine glycosylase n=1 Tax=Euzebya tangerina TaxID=591198 RepID=UPI00196B127F|nr:DNA-3-methyladenine glycosylase [Euzebya tangerina]
MTHSVEPLPRSFFERHAPLVARDLIGTHLVAPSGVRAEVVEVEAYDQKDPAAHTYGGPTPRNEVMFGPAAHLYTYFVYGMHWCANIVTGQPGEGEAVLLRAARLLEGEGAVRVRRGTSVAERDLLRGPARLAAGLGLGRTAGGADLLAPDAPLRVVVGAAAPGATAVEVGPRVGVRLAADVPWRFVAAGSRWVSDYRRHPRAAPRAT